MRASREVDPDELATVAGLERLAAPHGGCDPLGVGILLFTDEHVDLPGLDDADLGDEAALVARLREACPPADVEESDLLSLDPAFVLVEDDLPVAAAGYTEWVGLLAHVGVVTAPDHRRRGRGMLAAAAATNDALASGLVPQWRSAGTTPPRSRPAAVSATPSSAPRPRSSCARPERGVRAKARTGTTRSTGSPR